MEAQDRDQRSGRDGNRALTRRRFLRLAGLTGAYRARAGATDRIGAPWGCQMNAGPDPRDPTPHNKVRS